KRTFQARSSLAWRNRLRIQRRARRPSAFATWLRFLVGCNPPRLAIPSWSCAIFWTYVKPCLPGWPPSLFCGRFGGLCFNFFDRRGQHREAFFRRRGLVAQTSEFPEFGDIA